MGWFGFGLRKRNKKFKKRRKTKLALVLSGGAGRGIGHIGAIKAFQKHGIEFDMVIGTSAGSLVGACYASGISGIEMEEVVNRLKISDITGKKPFFLPSSTSALEETVSKILGGEKVFSELKKPFVAVATNLRTGKEVRIGSGSVARAVASSCAVPAYFKPVKWDDKVLVDGGLVNSVPIDVARNMGADYVIAVDVNATRGDGTEKLKLGSIISSTIGIMLKKNAKSYLEFADFCIFPKLKEYKSTRLDNAQAMIDEGERATEEHIQEIIEILNKKPKKKGLLCNTNTEVEFI